MDTSNINHDFAKLATTASVLVNSATSNANINEMLQKNNVFQSTFDSQGNNNKHGGGNGKGLIGLLAKHEDNLRIGRVLKRSNFTSDGKKKKDFNILTNEMLNDIPESDQDISRSNSSGQDQDDFNRNENDDKPFSLFQGFSAILPQVDETINNIKQMSGKLIEDSNNNNKNNNKSTNRINGYSKNVRNSNKIDEISSEKIKSCQSKKILDNFTSNINYYLDLMEIRKGLGKSEINEIDSKIDRLFLRRKEITDDIKYYEEREILLENHLLEIKERLEFIKDIIEPESEESNENINDINSGKKLVNKNEKIKANNSIDKTNNDNEKNNEKNNKADEENISDDSSDDYVTVNMEDNASTSGYSRITHTTKNTKPGDQIHQFQAHNESINCIAFDQPYNKMITCSIDNTVRLWNLNKYKCIGLLEGHYASVECVTIDNNLAFTGSHDATIKLWDLDYFDNKNNSTSNDNYENENKPLLKSFEGHMDTVTAISYSNGELVSGSEDKTIRQWDLNTGHLIQTMDIMWASSMANSMINFGNDTTTTANINRNDNKFRNNIQNNNNNKVYPYISSLQVFDAALATGTNDGIVRLWDLRSGEVIRQLFGHTGPVTTIQFDKNFNLITGSADRSVRIWDLRSGGLMDSYSYENPIKKLVFDDFKIASVVENESGVRIYDRTEQRHWQIGGGESGDTNDDTYTTGMAFEGNYLTESNNKGVVTVWNV